MEDVVGRGTVLAGRYRVLQPMGSDLEGSSAWKATDQILDRPVHVRILSSENAPQALDAARRAALVSDPRLVRILDVGNHEGISYVVTEQVSGPSLGELVARGPLTSDQARSIVGEAAAALEVARRRGVHHLALRPSVLHLTPEGRLVISGLALDGALLGHGVGDAAATTRADAVGLVRLLYTALTGLWPAGDSGIVAAHLRAAPEVDGVPTPPADLVPGVRPDLDTLCAVTLGAHDDGPSSPAELIRELEPWGEIRTVGLLDATAALDRTQLQQPVPDAPAEADATARLPMPGLVQRQSVRSAFNDQPSAGTGRPGTPPPAHPRGRGAFPPPANDTGAAVWPASAAPAADATRVQRPAVPQPGSVPPGSVPPATAAHGSAPDSRPPAGQARQHPVGGAQGQPPRVPPPSVPTSPFDFSGEADDDETVTTRRFDPTKLVLIVVAAVLVIGVVIALTSLFSPVDNRSEEPGAAPEASTSASEQPSESPSDQSSPSPSPSKSAQADTGEPPVIASATTFDPSGGDGEHEEAVGKAIDGDMATFWPTRWYNNATFGGAKDGLGFILTLDGTATVSSVNLQLSATQGGGNVEIRSGSVTGPVLASGPMSADTSLELSTPTSTDTIVLWFTELPPDTNGKYSIQLNEVTLS